MSITNDVGRSGGVSRDRLRHRLVRGAAVVVATTTLAVGLIAAPAAAEIKSGGSLVCSPSQPVYTYNVAQGTVWHMQSNGGTPIQINIGAGLSWAYRERTVGFTSVTMWTVFGSSQYNDGSGARCGPA